MNCEKSVDSDEKYIFPFLHKKARSDQQQKSFFPKFIYDDECALPPTNTRLNTGGERIKIVNADPYLSRNLKCPFAESELSISNTGVKTSTLEEN